MKKITAFLLSLVMVCSLAFPAMAADNYADVSENDWFAEAAKGLRDREIMNGVGNNRFGPNETFTRAALATVLYRMAGNPAVSGGGQLHRYRVRHMVFRRGAVGVAK